MLKDGLVEFFDKIKDFFWGIGYFGWQISFVYALYVCFSINIVEGILFFILFAFTGWINEKLLKEFVHNLRPKDSTMFLASEKKVARSNGMPSGHAQQTAFALTISYMLTHKYLNESLALFLLTVLQRFVYKNHTFAQLLAGTVLGVAFGVAGYYMLTTIEPRLTNVEENVLSRLGPIVTQKKR